MTYLAEVVGASVLVGVRESASPEGHAIQDDSERFGTSSGQHPSCVLEVQLMPTLDPARVAGPGGIHLRNHTVKEELRTSLKAISEQVEYLIAVLPAKQMLDILHKKPYIKL